MLQQMAAVAELEAGFISDRTKRALAAAKARGQRLGGNRGTVLTKAARKAGRDAQAARATARAADLAPVVRKLRDAGVTGLAAMARALSERSIPNARGGGTWTATQVARILARLRPEQSFNQISQY
jgi:DNA invertase Pin-like site-specific DNA recombinase